MGTTLITPSDTARIEALLSLLDPDAGGYCQVPGCTHAHRDLVTGEGGVTVLAA